MKIDITRAWKDETYRDTLSESERALLPQNPAGGIELDDSHLEDVAGGVTQRWWSLGCCSALTEDPCQIGPKPQ